MCIRDSAKTASPFAQRSSGGEVRLGDGSQRVVDRYEVTRDEARDADGAIPDKLSDSQISFSKKTTTSSGKTEPLIEMSISNRGTLSNPASDPVERQMRLVIIGHLIDGLRAS